VGHEVDRSSGPLAAVPAFGAELRSVLVPAFGEESESGLPRSGPHRLTAPATAATATTAPTVVSAAVLEPSHRRGAAGSPAWPGAAGDPAGSVALYASLGAAAWG